MTNDFSGSDLFSFTMKHSAAARVIRYREEAARFQRMAQTETNGKLRQSLEALAQQYEELAGSIEPG